MFSTPINDSETIPIQTVVWVPVNDSSGGNLVVTRWSKPPSLVDECHCTSGSKWYTWVVQLAILGILGYKIRVRFCGKHHYNSCMPRMTLGTTRENLKLTSWRSYQDPSTGNSTTQLVLLLFCVSWASYMERTDIEKGWSCFSGKVYFPLGYFVMKNMKVISNGRLKS